MSDVTIVDKISVSHASEEYSDWKQDEIKSENKII